MSTAQQRLHLEQYARVQRNDVYIDLRLCESERLLWKKKSSHYVYQQRSCMRNLLRPVFAVLFVYQQHVAEARYVFVSLFNPSKDPYLVDT